MSRIIGGRAKGLPLMAPKGSATRPTTDRVKEALFSSLVTWFGSVDRAPEEQLDGVAVLDLFAGTGAVGLEAASRGASRVTLVDSRTAPVIRQNAERAGLGVTVLGAKAEPALATVGGPWDLVFIDPPYDVAGDAVDRVLAALVAGELLAPQGLVVLERSKRSAAPVWPAHFPDVWDRSYGETVLHFGATAPLEEDAE